MELQESVAVAILAALDKEKRTLVTHPEGYPAYVRVVNGDVDVMALARAAISATMQFEYEWVRDHGPSRIGIRVAGRI